MNYEVEKLPYDTSLVGAVMKLKSLCMTSTLCVDGVVGRGECVGGVTRLSEDEFQEKSLF